jgi:MYXO-CTERM domain-containing protein
MKKRFVLSAAGISAVAIGASATADVVNVQFNMDKYPGEAEFFIYDASSVLIATEAAWGGVSGDSRFLSSSYGYFNGSDAASGVWTGVNMDLAAGVYTVVMSDSYGDGWNDIQWGGPNTGEVAFSGPYGSNIAFTSGTSATGTFTVVPAPGAVALLALAGLAGTRRRK